MVKILIERINVARDVGFTMYILGEGHPCIALISGETKLDGCGTATLQRLVEEIKDRSIQGTIKIIPQINEFPSMFDINKCLKNSTITSSPLCRLVDKIQEALPTRCLVIEVVCKNSFIPHIVVPPHDHEPLDGVLQNLVKSIPIGIIVEHRLKNIGFKLAKKGYKVVTIVGRGGKVFDLNDIEYLSGVILDALTNLGFVKRKAKPKTVDQKIFGRYNIIKCMDRGLFIPAINVGIEVEKGSTIGTLNDTEIRVQHSGVVLYISRPRLCEVDETICITVSQT